MSIPLSSLTYFKALSMSVKVRRPRKSILRSPSCSSSTILYCVEISSPLRERGTKVSTGFGAIKVPQAWVETFRGVPSSFIARSQTFLTVGSLSYNSRSSGIIYLLFSSFPVVPK